MAEHLLFKTKEDFEDYLKSKTSNKYSYKLYSHPIYREEIISAYFIKKHFEFETFRKVIKNCCICSFTEFQFNFKNYFNIDYIELFKNKFLKFTFYQTLKSLNFTDEEINEVYRIHYMAETSYKDVVEILYGIENLKRLKKELDSLKR
ncbi:MAG: hypothetical protein Q4D26_11005 [Clostridia bacterium]|nr:hypothetical protein [Clostridia bacterium]